MIYYKDDSLTIRSMVQHDSKIFYDTYLSYGWHPCLKTYKNYYSEQTQGIRKVFIAEFNGEIAGICTLLLKSIEGPFVETNYPQVSDLSVFIDFRNKGIASKLLDVAENEAFMLSDTVCLAVGVHSGYGQAQRIYVKRGYNFDGSGVWYRGKQLEQYTSCINDDDLLLYMIKKIRKQ